MPPLPLSGEHLANLPLGQSSDQPASEQIGNMAKLRRSYISNTTNSSLKPKKLMYRNSMLQNPCIL